MDLWTCVLAAIFNSIETEPRGPSWGRGFEGSHASIWVLQGGAARSTAAWWAATCLCPLKWELQSPLETPLQGPAWGA